MEQDCREHRNTLNGFGKRVTDVELNAKEHSVNITTLDRNMIKLETNIWEAIDKLRDAHTVMMGEMNKSITSVLVKISWIYGAMFAAGQVAPLLKPLITGGE